MASNCSSKCSSTTISGILYNHLSLTRCSCICFLWIVYNFIFPQSLVRPLLLFPLLSPVPLTVWVLASSLSFVPLQSVAGCQQKFTPEWFTGLWRSYHWYSSPGVDSLWTHCIRSSALPDAFDSAFSVALEKPHLASPAPNLSDVSGL